MDASRQHNRIGGAFIGLGIVLYSANAAWAQDSEVPRVVTEYTHVVKIGVGRSEVVEAPWPMVRVAVADPEVADVEILSPTRLLVIGNKIGATDLFLWNQEDESWRAQISVGVDLSSLQAELAGIFPGSSLNLVLSQDVLVVTGSLRRSEHAAQLLAILDAYGVKYVDGTSVAGVHQVLLQVRLAEVSRDAIRALGINSVYAGSDFFGAVRIGSSGGGPINPISFVPTPGAPATGLPFIFGESGLGAGVSLVTGFPTSDLVLFFEALAENQYARILAEPSLIALSGEKASFLAGGEFPIPIVQGSSAGGGTTITIEYKEFGVKLNFQPFVLGDDTIRLHVAPEVSELSDFGAVIIEGFRIPSVLTRRAETTLELKSGQTFAMAGLLKQTNAGRSTRIPFLGDLPVIGPLFRSVRYTQGETELLVMVTASLVEPLSWSDARPMPGDLHEAPNDWDLYMNGQIEAPVPALAPPDAERLQEMGFHRLHGPGAWASHYQPPAVSARSASPEPPLDPRPALQFHQ